MRTSRLQFEVRSRIANDIETVTTAVADVVVTAPLLAEAQKVFFLVVQYSYGLYYSLIPVIDVFIKRLQCQLHALKIFVTKIMLVTQMIEVCFCLLSVKGCLFPKQMSNL